MRDPHRTHHQGKIDTKAGSEILAPGYGGRPKRGGPRKRRPCLRPIQLVTGPGTDITFGRGESSGQKPFLDISYAGGRSGETGNLVGECLARRFELPLCPVVAE